MSEGHLDQQLSTIAGLPARTRRMQRPGYIMTVEIHEDEGAALAVIRYLLYNEVVRQVTQTN